MYVEILNSILITGVLCIAGGTLSIILSVIIVYFCFLRKALKELKLATENQNKILDDKIVDYLARFDRQFSIMNNKIGRHQVIHSGEVGVKKYYEEKTGDNNSETNIKELEAKVKSPYLEEGVYKIENNMKIEKVPTEYIKLLWTKFSERPDTILSYTFNQIEQKLDKKTMLLVQLSMEVKIDKQSAIKLVEKNFSHVNHNSTENYIRNDLENKIRKVIEDNIITLYDRKKRTIDKSNARIIVNEVLKKEEYLFIDKNTDKNTDKNEFDIICTEMKIIDKT